MIKLLFTLPLLLLSMMNVYAANQDDLQDQPLRDPTARGRNYKRAAEALVSDRAEDTFSANSLLDRVRRPTIKSALSDPTQMSSRFRQALRDLRVRTTTTELTSTGKLPPFPKVSLAAIVFSEDEEAYSMLHIDKKTVLVRVGDKASFVDKDTVIDVVVKEINRNDVRLAIFPANEIIILR